MLFRSVLASRGRAVYFGAAGEEVVAYFATPRVGLPCPDNTNPADHFLDVSSVDLRSGDAVHWIRFEGMVDELYDVITLPGVRNPSLIGFVSDEIRRLISIES